MGALHPLYVDHPRTRFRYVGTKPPSTCNRPTVQDRQVSNFHMCLCLLPPISLTASPGSSQGCVLLLSLSCPSRAHVRPRSHRNKPLWACYRWHGAQLACVVPVTRSHQTLTAKLEWLVFLTRQILNISKHTNVCKKPESRTFAI